MQRIPPWLAAIAQPALQTSAQENQLVLESAILYQLSWASCSGIRHSWISCFEIRLLDQVSLCPPCYIICSEIRHLGWVVLKSAILDQLLRNPPCWISRFWGRCNFGSAVSEFTVLDHLFWRNKYNLDRVFGGPLFWISCFGICHLESCSCLGFIYLR